MSSLYFSSPDGEAAVSRQEWHRLWNLLHDFTVGIVNVRSPGGSERMEELTGIEVPRIAGPEDHAAWRQWVDAMEKRFFTAAPGPGISWQGRELNKLGIIVNTALAAGGDPLMLAARLIAQADEHCWAEGRDRAWLAGIIDQGLASGVLSTRLLRYGSAGLWEPVGWQDVTALLRAAADEPVVISYSSSGSFPGGVPGSRQPAPDDGAERRAQGAALTSGGRWQACMDDLRARRPGARLDPGAWQDIRFDDSVSAFDLLADDYMHRLNQAVGAIPGPGR